MKFQVPFGKYSPKEHVISLFLYDDDPVEESLSIWKINYFEKVHVSSDLFGNVSEAILKIPLFK